MSYMQTAPKHGVGKRVWYRMSLPDHGYDENAEAPGTIESLFLNGPAGWTYRFRLETQPAVVLGNIAEVELLEAPTPPQLAKPRQVLPWEVIAPTAI